MTQKIDRITYFWIRKTSKIETNFSEFMTFWKKHYERIQLINSMFKKSTQKINFLM